MAPAITPASHRRLSPDFRTRVMGALSTGCRRSELMRMRAVHVGCDGYGVHVMPVKATKPRFVFLPDEGMAFFLALARGEKPDEFLFRQHSGTSWKYNFGRKFDKAKKRAGIAPNFTFHGLRHTYASQLIQAGAPLIVVADQLGHANTMQVVKTYGHLSPQIRESEVRQRFTSISREFEAIADADGEKFAAWRKALHGGGWRTYATIHDLASVRNTRR